ncbi:hypothetical protein [Nocardioides sp. T2.26MG-1]|uniref:hypothetical protein n=1 Tax=Nocardioides sp. T2.26MG-1 TaxID=3041166 RepID=UPI0025405F45|nr:hypothetical protein [Nocardioides sp. T2.26MG-1]
MTDITVLNAALERAIGPGPEGPELSTLLHHGHRSVRRRRVGAAATLALAAIATAGVVHGLDGAAPSSSSRIEPATTGPSDAGRLDETLHGREQVWDAGARHLAAQRGLSIEADGSIVFPTDVVVVRHIDDALHRAPEEQSVGYVVREDGEDVWYLGRLRATGGAQSLGHLVTGRPGVDAPTFEDWLAQQGAP